MLLIASCGMMLFATIGYGIGWVAGQIVADAVQTRVASELAAMELAATELAATELAATELAESAEPTAA